MGTETRRSNRPESTNIHSLILKIWRRNGGSPGAQPTWHGQVTHVPSGERVYSNDPNELLITVATHLRMFGVRMATCWRLGAWFHERKHRSDRGTP